VVGCNPPNHLGDLYEMIMIRTLFSSGQCEPCVILLRRKIRGEFGGIL